MLHFINNMLLMNYILKENIINCNLNNNHKLHLKINLVKKIIKNNINQNIENYYKNKQKINKIDIVNLKQKKNNMQIYLVILRLIKNQII